MYIQAIGTVMVVILW